MDNNQSNFRSKLEKEIAGGDTAVQKAESSSHFKRNLVPLEEYAARQGISSDVVEQQGQLGVIQIRKFKGQKFVVDVSPEELSEFENENAAETIGKPVVPRSKTSSKILTIGLASGIMLIIVSLFLLYMTTKTKLDDLNIEYKSLQSRYDEMAGINRDLKTMQENLAAGKTELARIQNRITTSRTDMEKIQGDLNKTKRNLDAIQSEFTTMQGQISLSKVELESIQNSLNENRNQLDNLYKQNSAAGSK
jgi:peptidoglycan hydrolase CwlO-like protein